MQKKKVLVIDDEQIVLDSVCRILKEENCEVEISLRGQQGLDRALSEEYDMVLTDIDMPRMNGFELIRKIKSHETLKSLPVIIVSYKMSEEDRLEGFEAGADYYLHKTDFDDTTLINAVVDLIGEA